MYHDGNNSKNSVWSAEDTEFAFSGRVEWLAHGEWKNLADWDGFRDEGSGVVVGGAFNWQKSEFGTATVETENFSVTADVDADFGGGSIGGAIIYRSLNTDATSTELDQWGAFVRGGVFVTDDWEVFGQYEWADLETAGVEDLSVLTIGATKFFAKHTLKWQNDVGYAFNSVGAGFASDGAGWRTDTASEDGQVVIRSQLQLLF